MTSSELFYGYSATYSLPRLIDHNQIWSAGIYLELLEFAFYILSRTKMQLRFT